MPYQWSYVKHGARVQYTNDPGVPGAYTVDVGTVVNGLVAQALCDQLEESDPTGALLVRNGECTAFRNSGPDHAGDCYFTAS